MFKNLTGKIRFLLAWAGVIMMLIDVIEYALKKCESVKMPDWKSEPETVEKVAEIEKVNTDNSSDISKNQQHD